MPDIDVLVMQRTTHSLVAESIPHFQRKGVAVVIDVDDDLQHLPPGHSLRRWHDPALNPEQSWRGLKRACALADVVTHSTPALGHYAPYGRGTLLHNYVPRSYLDIQRPRDGRTIGWGGLVDIHSGDLEVTHCGVSQAINDFNAKFLHVGAGDLRKGLALDDEPETTGLLEFAVYPQEIGRLDIGIAPLADNRFSRAKTPLKGMEYAALSVAWVASDLPEYAWLQGMLGVGQLCKPRSRDWFRALRRLLTDDSYREDQQMAGRAAVEEKMCIEDNAWRWAEAWDEAVANLRLAA